MSTFQTHRPPEDCLHCERRHQQAFCNFTANALSDFDKIGVLTSYTPGAKLFSQGDTARNVFVICFGQVEISTTSRNGDTMILKIAGPSDVLGLSAVLADVAHEATAQVIQPCQVKTIRKQEIFEFFGRHSIASLHAAEALSADYLDVFHDAQRLALPKSAPGRLARLLLDWGRRVANGKPEIRFTMALTHEQIAAMAGMSRETVTRSLNQFRRNQWIIVHGTSFTIAAPEQLERIAG